MITTEDFHLVWFPPDFPVRERSFKTLDAARRFLAKDDVKDPYPAREWNPILSHRITTVVEETIRL